MNAKRWIVGVGSVLAAAVAVPVIAHHSRAAASQTFEVDYVLAQRNRF